MKKTTLNLLVILLAMLINFACSSDKDDKNDTDLGLNITTPALDEKSGGVYFVSTYAGEYIFRLNLKNGNDLMVCDMFHNEKYSDLTAEIRDWQVGENLTHFEFSKDDIQLLISLDQGGEPESKLVIDNNVFKTIAFKSTVKEPIKVYSGNLTTYKTPDYNEKNIFNSSDILIILKNEYYYNGAINSEIPLNKRIEIGVETDDNTNFEKAFYFFEKKEVRFLLEKEDLIYNENKIEFYESFIYDSEYDHLLLHRRFL